MKKKIALVIIDAQNDFVYDALRNEDAIKALPTVKKALEYAREHNFERVFTRDTHDDNYLKTQEGKNLPVPHCIYGTDGWDVCDEVWPHDDEEYVIDKSSFGTLDFPDFEYLEVDEIWMCGFCTDICVSANFQILKAMYPDIPIVVISDACAGVTPAKHEAALEVMRSCQAKVVTFDELMKGE